MGADRGRRLARISSSESTGFKIPRRRIRITATRSRRSVLGWATMTIRRASSGSRRPRAGTTSQSPIPSDMLDWKRRRPPDDRRDNTLMTPPCSPSHGTQVPGRVTAKNSLWAMSPTLNTATRSPSTASRGSARCCSLRRPHSSIAGSRSFPERTSTTRPSGPSSTVASKYLTSCFERSRAKGPSGPA